MTLHDKTVHAFRQPDGSDYREQTTAVAGDSLAVPGTAPPLTVTDIVP